MPSDPQGEPEAIPSVQEFYDALHPTMPSDPQAVAERLRRAIYSVWPGLSQDDARRLVAAIEPVMARALAESEERAELGDAWAAAEAALPLGCRFEGVRRWLPARSALGMKDQWVASYDDDGGWFNFYGPTPAAALRALAAA